MALKVAQTGGGDFEIVPEGQYTARCFKVIDLGTQTVEWNGEEKQQPKIMVSWEILDDNIKMQDNRPFAVTKQYTASLHEKSSLYKDLVAWRGKAFTKEELLGFDISKLVGAYCQLQVVHVNGTNGKTYANINAIMATKERPKAVNPDVIFDVMNPDMNLFNSFSDWLKTKIRSSEEWIGREETMQPSKVEEGVTIEDIDAKDLDINNNDEIDPNDIPF